MLISMGVSQLNELDDYINSMGKVADGDTQELDSLEEITEALDAEKLKESEKLAELAGKENLNKVWYTTCYTTVNASDELKSFIDDYTAKYDQAPNMFSALAYDATNLVLDQLEATGKTGAELNEAIKKADFSGLTGSFVFDEKTHTPKKTVLVVNQKDGVQTEVDEVEVK